MEAQRNYLEYHKIINKAEVAFFCNKNPNLAIHLYDSVFSSYDFVFAQDAYTAAYIAAKSNRATAFYKFCNKAFAAGVPFKFIQKIAKLNPDLEVSRLATGYNEQRQKFIKSIDFELLDTIYSMVTKDFAFKDIKYEKENEGVTIKNAKYLFGLKRFPSEKYIGISIPNLMRHNKKQYLDFSERKKIAELYNPEFVDFNGSLALFKEPNVTLSNKYLFIILVHEMGYSYANLKSRFLDLVKKGELHPREFALLHDLKYQSERKNKLSTNLLETPFGIGSSFTNKIVIDLSNAALNEQRKKYLVCPIEVDISKREFEKIDGVLLSFGHWSHR